MTISEKKENILKAAGECFARYGYEKTTMDDIGKMVGLNKASLYYYYKNKESIFSDVIFHEREEYLQAVQERVSKAMDCKEKIINYLTERVRYIQKAINLHKLSMENLQKIQPIFQKLYQIVVIQEVEVIQSVLDKAVQKKEIIACDTKRVAENILTIADAIKQKEASCTDYRFPQTIDCEKVESDLVFTVSLIMDGLKK